MSAESLQRIYERFAGEVTQACAEGRSADLLDRYFKAISIDYANTVFLKMDAEASRRGFEPTLEFVGWVETFPTHCGLELIESVTTTLTAFNASAEQIDAAQISAATAYQEQLTKLFDGSRVGGRA